LIIVVFIERLGELYLNAIRAGGLCSGEEMEGARKKEQRGKKTIKDSHDG
jgi:hypothetical protein